MYTARNEPRFSRVNTQRESVVSRLQQSKPKIRLASEIAHQPSMYESSRPFASRVRIRRALRARRNACVCFAVRPFQMRVSEEFLNMVDDWRRRQKDIPSRAEAIRRMVELATRQRTTSASR